MKIIAMYLPQFHYVKENSQWWGEGFTDWTTVKNAKKLFEGHYQPREPFNGNYYDLMDINTFIWQSNLMKKYDVDGICMYHYWFKNGRKILEKPAENLLNHKEINMPFCFCWANETWARSWSNISKKNIWSEVFENSTANKNSSGILLEQKYGNEEQWKKHFEYLLPFFQDKRYIKIDDKPVFLIYKPSDIYCLCEMIDYWRKLAIEYGLKGIYVIGMNSNTSINSVDAQLIHEPANKSKKCNAEAFFKNKVRILAYDEVWKKILNADGEKNTFFGGFVGYDDTPRRGENGTVIEGATPEKFASYLTELVAKNYVNNKSPVFINAWNEWGEGMYLEPDSVFEYGYLKAIKYAKEHYLEYTNKYLNYNFSEGIVLNEEIKQRNKTEHYLEILDCWLKLMENNVSLEQYLLGENFKNIAIYGYGLLGKHLYRQLVSTSINVNYIIDMRKNEISMKIPVYSPEEDLPFVDAVIVSAVFSYEEIFSILKNKGIKRIISLETILLENINYY